MRNAVLGNKETYRGPVEDLLEPQRRQPTKSHSLPSRQLWIGRDDDGALFLYPSQPNWTGHDFVPQEGGNATRLSEEWFPEVEPGFCQAFVKEGPRVDKRVKPNGPAT